jgi:glycosyltransferase involved in cell wall biosynthesis
MKSLVMIAHSFPPDASAGVYRPLRFLRQLPSMGWSVSVVAADPADTISTRHDPELLTLIPEHVDVIRVRCRDPWHVIQVRRAQRTENPPAPGPVASQNGHRASHNGMLRSHVREFVRTVEAWCYHPDLIQGWITPAVEATIRACKSTKAQVIVATGGPWSSFVVADRASRRTGIPYVLDFRDSWTLAHDEFWAKRPSWAKHLDRRTLSGLFERAQAIILRYATEAECYWRAYKPALDSAKIHLIPNGYDGRIDDSPAPRGDRCTILYAGTLPPYRFDTLVSALEHIRKTDPERAERMRLVFVGDGMEALAAEIELRGLTDMIGVRGVVPQAEVKQLQKCAQALLLLGLKPGRGYEFCGSKVFSYLQAGRPIIGVLPHDETRKVLEQVGVSTVADIESPDEIAALFRTIVDAWTKGTLSPMVPDPAACERYSAPRQTASLVRALDGTPPVEPFVPGSVEVPPSLRNEIGERGWLS